MNRFAVGGLWGEGPVEFLGDDRLSDGNSIRDAVRRRGIMKSGIRKSGISKAHKSCSSDH